MNMMKAQVYKASYYTKITERNTWATATHILNSWVNVHGQAEQISYFLFTIGK